MDSSTYDSSLYDSSLYDSSASISSSADAGAVALMLGIIGFAMLISYVVCALFMGMMFKKAGVPAWKAWVPVYSGWVFLELGGQKGWLSLLFLLSWIPFIGFIPAIVAFVYTVIAAYRIGLNFGKEGWFVAVYLLLGVVWLIWLALDKTAVWKPTVAGAPPVASPQPITPVVPQQPSTPEEPTQPQPPVSQ